MKRFAWLLVLPYALITSTSSTIWEITFNGQNAEFCFDEQVCLDKVYALNDAHAKRLADDPPKRKIGFETEPLKVIPNSGRVYRPVEVHTTNFDYKDACGADDCGKEP